MVKRIRDLADYLKTNALPKLDRDCIALDDKVELHGRESKPASFFERKLRHLPSDSLAAGVGRDHISGIRDVRTKAGLVCLYPERPDDPSAIHRNVGVFFAPKPIRYHLVFGRVGRKDVGVVAGDHRLDYLPHG